jgi:hypothetical protein
VRRGRTVDPDDDRADGRVTATPDDDHRAWRVRRDLQAGGTDKRGGEAVVPFASHYHER